MGAYILGPSLHLSLVREGAGTAPPSDVGSPAKVAAELRRRLDDDGRERFGAVLVNVRHVPIGIYIVSVGTLSASLVHPREVFGPALMACAHSLIAFHNHPSGNPEPSAEDHALTRRLADAGTLLGVPLLDHIVLGSGTTAYWSAQEKGRL